ncbi:MAG: DUF488 domain-containing protein [Nitrosotalea sp.]
MAIIDHVQIEKFKAGGKISHVRMLRMESQTTHKVPNVMISTKSIYQPKEQNDGIRILITRFYPRGVKKDHFDVWIRELAPSPELLQSYKQGQRNWDEFKMSFLSELRDNIDSLEVIHALNQQNVVKNITLLCYERDGTPCHRHMVKNIIEEPNLLKSFFVSENTDNHEITPMQSHVSYEETCVIP